MACLTHGAAGRPLLDNGHGSARMAVFRHKHEIESGRTSSLSQQLLGYAADGALGRRARKCFVAASQRHSCTSALPTAHLQAGCLRLTKVA